MKILICPLNWGLGHATRCVPIIHKLIAQGNEISIASDGFPLEFLQLQFPQVKIIELPSYSIKYSASKTQVFAMLWNLPSIIYGVFREHKWLRKQIKKEHYDQVISDNRFGMWNRHTHSVYITHQLMIKMPSSLKLLEPLVWLLHQFIIRHYDECWVPDTKGSDNLSGDLSHKYPISKKVKFIGLLSRFENYPVQKIDESYEIVSVLSGLEPQRSIFENQLLHRFQNSGKTMLIVCGQPNSEKRIYHVGDVTLVSHLNDDELVAILRGAKQIIARSGYSSIMDLKALNCLHKVEFIPTPGQTEQEYLFSLHLIK